ncbi:MAG: hypothetical protein H0U48_09795 [Euzebyaceae bacterium]|nr:hypothetical protein [Euzebyaceae bacterium]
MTGTGDVRRPWLPDLLRDAGHTAASVGALFYVFVDEIVDDTVTLTVSRWPDADAAGRLRFHDLDARRHVGVTLPAVRAGLYQRAVEEVTRSPRVGDVFAAEVSPAAAARLAATDDEAEWRQPLHELFPAEIHDVSVEARTVAKLAFYGAAAAVLPETEAGQRQLLGDLASHPDDVGAASTPATPDLPPWHVPAELLDEAHGEGFLDACRADGGSALVYFVLNVGDGDTQVLLLPADANGHRCAVVVDVASRHKLPALLKALQAKGILPAVEETGRRPLLPLVIATHPHDDHIGGLPQLLDDLGAEISEFWEPGYYHPSDVYVETMVALERRRDRLRHLQPTSGLSCYLDQVKITVLAPGIGLRNRFDSYGTHINDASIALKVEYPATRIAEQREGPHHNRVYVRNDPWALLLGADAQTTAWAQATLDFPEVHSHSDADLARELRLRAGRDTLRGHVFKVPHHASKHGLNLELVTRIQPTMALVSCSADGRYGFPHDLALEAIRESRLPTASRGGRRPADHDLGIHYTCAVSDGNGRPALGSMALVVSASRGKPLQLWRFADGPRDEVRLDHAVRMTRTHLSQPAVVS